MKKQYFILLDSETTQDQMVADFGAIICDRKGNILNQIAVLTNGIFTDFENHPLFFTSDKNGIWSKDGQDKRYKVYQAMLDNGGRMIASIPAINKWLVKAQATYDPIMTAYNLPFDLDKCQNTGIDLTVFNRSFCLWSAAYTSYSKTKAYRKAVLQLHAFNAPTPFQNMTFKTNAETMARFCTGQYGLVDEPHTSLEDVIFYELPILRALCRKHSVKWLLSETQSYNWRACQVKDWFKPS